MEATKKKRKKWPWIVLAIVVAVVVAVIILTSVMAERANAVAYTSYTVARGDVETTITGSGRLRSADSVSVELPSGVTVDEVYAKTGDAVSAGDVLATLDAESLSYCAAQLSQELTALDGEMGDSDTQSYIYPPVSGRIKYLPVAYGDDVLTAINEYGALAVISTDGWMQVEIETAAQLSPGDAVTVGWEQGTAEGEVYSRTAAGYLITLPDDDAPYMAAAQVYDGDALIGSGTIEIHAPISVFGTGGTIDEINFSENDKVTAKSKLFTLRDGFYSDSYRQALSDRNDKAAELQAVLRLLADPRLTAPVDGIVSEVGVSEGTEAGASAAASSGGAGAYSYSIGVGSSLTEATAGIEPLSVDLATASNPATPTSTPTTTPSTLATITTTPPAGYGSSAQGSYSFGSIAAVGTTTATAGTDSEPVTAFVIDTGGAVKMDIDVDELDIDTVALGQQVEVTLDAFPTETFAAEVTHISRLGTASGSITTYEVEVTLSGDGRLLSGMNGSAVIKAQSVTDALMIPVAAINEDATGMYVNTTADGGATLARADITTGLSDGTYAEVTGGLSEGDVICYVDTSSQSGLMFGGFGAMGGMGGGMNGGDMGDRGEMRPPEGD